MVSRSIRAAILAITESEAKRRIAGEAVRPCNRQLEEGDCWREEAKIPVSEMGLQRQLVWVVAAAVAVALGQEEEVVDGRGEGAGVDETRDVVF